MSRKTKKFIREARRIIADAKSGFTEGHPERDRLDAMLRDMESVAVISDSKKSEIRRSRVKGLWPFGSVGTQLKAMVP